ncbi:hypothetical protein EWK04_08980 [Salmonella enterica subsp. enterica serovar Java]|uniref:Uncharacterized protein n=2 Tax=Salmonella enterica TaxID=28901 RepID=A0A5V3WLQ7_SALER|nr:hypothetical protein [Salmonella enterica subsp. enterica serovar Java]EBM2192478.1 hypothetical protein [Salmonella enterica]EDD5837946.1 hypothetical protein [Salmonella enterica subsp. enterica serovar Enteritidis]HCM8924238.1 hypothetical protein [Salmonella enterica subsp. enterica serovar Paratyphi B]EBN4399625.1 hypothetical protein [Salmonella enterica]
MNDIYDIKYQFIGVTNVISLIISELPEADRDRIMKKLNILASSDWFSLHKELWPDFDPGEEDNGRPVTDVYKEIHGTVKYLLSR